MFTTASAPRVTRRPAQAQDLPFLREMFADVRDDLLLTPDIRDVIVEQRFHTHRRRLRTEHPDARQDIVLLADAPVGRLVVAEDDRTTRIVDLAVRREHRCRGIGTAVLAAVLTEAEAAGRDLRMLTWSDGPGVRRFCLDRGFTVARSVTGGVDLVRVAPPA